MCQEALRRLDTDATTAKRAQYEAFEFSIDAPGIVTVRNGSHADPDEHTYDVTIEGDAPVACTCPSFQYHDGACKHMTAVAIREPVIEAATERAVATDGGEIIEAGDEGKILDETGGDTYTYHREPPHVGGAKYVRCELCGAESVPADPDAVYHDRDCPEAADWRAE